MKVALSTMVMIQNPQTNEVLVQERTKKWPGWSFPGGKLESLESFYECSVREIKEETGLEIGNLEACGVVHWNDTNTGDRYLVFLYKTQTFSGELIEEFPEGRHFWYDAKALMEVPKEKFSNENIQYCHLYFAKPFSEAYIPHNDESVDLIYF